MSKPKANVDEYLAELKRIPLLPTVMPLSSSDADALSSKWTKTFVDAYKKSHSVSPVPVKAQLFHWMKTAYQARNSSVVQSVASMVIDESHLKNYGPCRFRVEYFPQTFHLAIDYLLPSIDSVLEQVDVTNTRRVSDRGNLRISITSTTPGLSEDLYKNLLASITLRVFRGVGKADIGAIETISFNGYVQNAKKNGTICVLTLRTRREKILKANLELKNRWKLLAALGADLSAEPGKFYEVPVLKEFTTKSPLFPDSAESKAGRRASIETTTNVVLSRLDPLSFESLIANLLEKLGFSVKLTNCSHDGGVDCVAIDPRPLVGGRMIVQAKHYQGAVGVSAVRDLYGTLQHEGANKAILITTGTLSHGCHSFAQGKPIELIDGSQLIQMLKSVGIEAAI